MTQVCMSYLKSFEITYHFFRFNAQGTCSAGDSCSYIHEDKIPCLFFNVGICQNGAKCRFSHDKALTPNIPDDFHPLPEDLHNPKVGMELNALTFGGLPRPNPKTIFGHLTPNPDPNIIPIWINVTVPCTFTEDEPYHKASYYSLEATSAYKDYR